MAALLAPAAANAATITVNSAADASATECTLRGAIEAAAQNVEVDTCTAGQPGPAADTIEFALAAQAQIGLESKLPQLVGPLRIAGPGVDELLIDGRELVQIFDLPSGQAATISGVKIRGGFCGNDGACEGGAIRSAGNLTLANVKIQESAVEATGNAAHVARGGAIFNTGDLALIESILSGNRARATEGVSDLAAGGAIFNAGTLTIDRSTLETNSTFTEGPGASSFGGGVANEGLLVVVSSTLKGNETVANSTIGPALAAGGAIRSLASSGLGAKIERSTLTGNSVESVSAEGGSAAGGGVAATGSGTFVLLSSTVTANFGLGGANLDISAPGAVVRGTIVAAPSGGGPSCATPLPSAGFNLDDGTSCGFTQPTDLSSADPKLATLADNGGSTETMALEEGSPAIDRGIAGAGEGLDQRGLPRRSDFPGIANAVGGDGADIGAFELQGGLLPGESPPEAPRPPVPPIPDTTAPKLTVRGGPKRTFDRTPTFRFGSEPGAGFSCRVDKGRFLGCRSPFTTKRLAFGKHRVRLRALDAAGNASATVVLRVEVLRPRR